MTDNDEDGTEWCVKSGKGMTQAQIDAWHAEDAKEQVAEMHARAEPNNKNCMRELGVFKSYGVWYGPPSSPYIAGSDGLLAGLSIGQVVSAIRAEASALGLDARFIRVTVAANPPAREPWTLPDLAIFIPVALIFGAVLLIYIAAAFGVKP